LHQNSVLTYEQKVCVHFYNDKSFENVASMKKNHTHPSNSSVLVGKSYSVRHTLFAVCSTPTNV